MVNYIKAELYRNFNRLYFWLFTGIVSAMALLVNISLKFSQIQEVGLNFSVESLIALLGVPVFMVIVFVDMVTSEEQKNLTLRNVVDFGVPRRNIIISKFISSIILAFISAAIILTIYLGSGLILFGLGPNFPGTISTNIVKFLVAVVLWIGTISVGTFLALLFKGNNTFVFSYIVVFGAIRNIIDLLSFFVSEKFKYVYNILITTQLSNLKGNSVTNYDLGKAALIGVIYTVVFLIISIVTFNKQEVK